MSDLVTETMDAMPPELWCGPGTLIPSFRYVAPARPLPPSARGLCPNARRLEVYAAVRALAAIEPSTSVVARKLGVSRATVYRALNEQGLGNVPRP